MKKILNGIIAIVACMFICQSYSANTMTVTVQWLGTDGSYTTASTPNKVPASNINGLKVTITGKIASSSPFNINASGGGPSITNWGIYFSSSTTSPTAQYSCSANSSCFNISTSNIAIDQSNTSVTCPVTTGTNYACSGSITIVLNINGFSGTLPTDMQNLFNSNNVAVGFFYSEPNQSAASDLIDYALWQAELGTFIAGPDLQGGFNSVKALQNSFQVININPPKGDAVCPVASGSTSCPTSGVNDGRIAGTTGSLISAGQNTVSGYVIAFWNNATCNSEGGFVLSPNWMAYNYQGSNPSYTCNSLTTWNTDDKGGDTNSPTLGCAGASQTTFLPMPSGTLDEETASIPYIGQNADPKADLQMLIQNAYHVYQGQNSCVKYVYIPSSSSFTNTSIQKRDIYGVVVWALNNASNYDYPNLPNYSLGHSNVIFTTTADFILASGNLPLTNDCFVVTAASGDTNSDAVFYWRLLRDAYLTPIGITHFYYQHARTWAHWLNEHPSLKPPLNFIFAKSGYAFYHAGQFIKETNAKAKKEFHKFVNFVSGLFDNKASAAELTFNEVPQDNSKNKSNFGFGQNGQQNIDVVPEDMANDPFFQLAPKNSKIQPAYDVYIKGGILIPTQDKAIYDKYYSSQPTMFGEGGLARLFWSKNIGFSLGVQGRYLTNSQKDSADVLGAKEGYTRTLYAISGEVLGGMRYRNPSFTYLQPGFFVGGGLTRFRESATANGASSSGANGVTEYSSIYEAGVNLDVSLSAISGQSEVDASDILNEVLLRLSASYNVNQSKALSSTGYFVGAGFAFLIN